MNTKIIPIVMLAAGLAACSVQGRLGGVAAGAPPSSASGPSSGPVKASDSEHLVVPDLVLMTEGEASDALAKLGHRGSLDVQRDTGCQWRDDWVDEDIVEGQICQQKPAAGKGIASRVPVSVEVAGPREGSGFMAMPDFVGQPIDDVVEFLEAKGATRVEVRPGDCTDEGAVCKQSIRPRHKLNLDRTVTFHVGQEDEEY